MFNNSYQNGPPQSGIELLSANNKDMLKYIDIIGKSTKNYDRNIKGFMINIDDNLSNPSKLNCPSNQYKQNLGIIQPLLVFQIMAPIDKQKPLSIEIILTDTTGQRRRLHYSSNFRNIQSKNELHAQLPLDIPRGQWINLVFNLKTITSNVFKGGIYYHTLDSFSIRHGCLFRKIFTLPLSAIGENNDVNVIPAIYDYPLGTNSSIVNVDIASFNNISNIHSNKKGKSPSLTIEGALKEKTVKTISPLKIKGQSVITDNLNKIKSNKVESLNKSNATNNDREVKNIVDNHDEEILSILNTPDKYEYNGNSNQNFYDYIENINNEIDDNNDEIHYDNNNEIHDDNNNEIHDNNNEIYDNDSEINNNIITNDDEYDTNDNTNDDDDDNNINISPKTDNIISKVIVTKLFDKDQVLTKSYLQQSIFNFHNNNHDNNNDIDKRQKILLKVNKIQSRLSEEELSYKKEYKM